MKRSKSPPRKKNELVVAEDRTFWVLPENLVKALVAFWFALVAYQYYPSSNLQLSYVPTILDHWLSGNPFNAYVAHLFVPMLVAWGLAWVAFQFGNSILSRLFSAPLFSAERWLMGGCLGFGFMTLSLWTLGALHLWYASVLWGVTLGCILVFGILGHTPEWSSDGVAESPNSSGVWARAWYLLALLFLFFFIFGELTPEIFYDTLYYHIAIPNLYRLAHGIVPVPTLLFSNFVLTIQLLYGWALTLGSETSAKLLHGTMAVMLVAGFAAFERRFLSRGAGWIAAVLFLGMPLVGLNVITSGTDVGGSFFQMAAAFALIYHLTFPQPQSLVVAGLLTGLFASTKYPALPTIPIAGIVLLWARRWDDKAAWPTVLQELLIFWSCAMVFVAPMLLRNVAFHGNPLYPFGATHWGTPPIDSRHWDIFVHDAHTRDLRMEFQSGSSFFRFLFHPWFIAMHGADNGDFTGPLFLLLLPLVFLLKAPTRAYGLLRRYVAMLWVLWMTSTSTPRYGLPALALLALLLAEALVRLVRHSFWKPFFLGMVLLGSLHNLGWLLLMEYSNDGWQVVEGLLSRETYLSEMHASYPLPSFDAYEWMNQHLPLDAKVLIAGDARSYGLQRMMVPSSVPDPQPLVEYSRRAQTADEMATLMKNDHVTHIFLNFAEGARTESYGFFHWDPASWAVMSAFWATHVRLIWKEERSDAHNPKMLYVFEVLDEAKARAPHAPEPNPFERWRPQ